MPSLRNSAPSAIPPLMRWLAWFVGVVWGHCRFLQVHQWDFDWLGLYFQGFLYVDRAWPMGCSIPVQLLSFLVLFFNGHLGLRLDVNYSALS